MLTPFWSNEPTILFNKKYIFELWPTSNMTYEQKLNAISRLIVLISILGYIFTMSARIPIAGIATLIVIFILFKMRKQKITSQMVQEGFTMNMNNMNNNASANSNYTIVNPVTLESALKTDFEEGDKKNPFSNVLLTQIMDAPERKSAPPAFNTTVDEDITKNIKKTVQFLNPGIKNTNEQLYGDLWQNFELDQSNRAFFSTANTRVENDQAAFGKYLYGDMPSAKGSSTEDNIQREKDSFRYTLY